MSRASERAIRIQEACRIADEMEKSILAVKDKEAKDGKFVGKRLQYGVEGDTDYEFAHVSDKGRLVIASGGLSPQDALRLRDFITEWFGETEGGK